MNMTHAVWQYSGATLVVVALGLSGCGAGGSASGPVAHWHGKVTINGQPVPSDAQARISFMPEITRPGQKANPTSAEIVNSQYDAPKVPVGPVKVTFNIVRWSGQTTTAGAASSRPVPKWEFLVPEKYRDGMALEVEEGV